MSDRILVSSGSWAVASDGIQWMLCRTRKGPSPWYGVSFVHSTKDILARCMREKGSPPADAAVLLAALPDRFEEASAGPLGACYSDFDGGDGQLPASAIIPPSLIKSRSLGIL
jgi:hypothetical protein